jgi:hypothetical protein
MMLPQSIQFGRCYLRSGRATGKQQRSQKQSR